MEDFTLAIIKARKSLTSIITFAKLHQFTPIASFCLPLLGGGVLVQSCYQSCCSGKTLFIGMLQVPYTTYYVRNLRMEAQPTSRGRRERAKK